MFDFIFAFRQFRKTPVVTTIALLTLGLGIGASTALFSLVDRLLIHPVNFPQADQLVQLSTMRSDRPILNWSMSFPRFEQYRREQTVFTGLAARVADAKALTGVGDPALIFGERVTFNYFEVLGIKPSRGRVFTPDEEKPGNTSIVITEGFWRRRLGGDPGVVGRVLDLNGQPHTVIGVVPVPPPAWSRATEIWTTWPFSLQGTPQSEVEHGMSFLLVIGRLRPEIALKKAQAEMEHLDALYSAAHPANNDVKRTVVLRVLRDYLTEDLRPTFIILVSAAFCLLIIACSNVANLLLARSMERKQEIAVRTALGASRVKVIRLFLIESVLFGLVAGFLGISCALGFLKLVPWIAGNLLPVGASLDMRWSMLWFAVGSSFIIGIIVGIFPAWQGTRANVSDGLKEGGRSATSSASARRFRSCLLVGQVAVSLALLSAAGVLYRSFEALQQQNLGFRTDHLFLAAVDLPPSRYKNTESRHQFAERLIEDLRSRPGIESVSVVQGAPLTGNRRSLSYARAEEISKPMADRTVAVQRNCTPGYLQTLGIPILAGRDFESRDTPRSARVIIISQSIADRLFAHENPVGQHLLVGSEKGTGIPAEIVGVVAPLRSLSVRKEGEDEIYVPWAQTNIPYVQIVAHTSAQTAAIEPTIRAAILRLDPLLPLIRQTTMDELRSQSLGESRLLMSLVIVFATLAFALAMIGVYSVLAYTVSQRTAEIGIRITLGAARKDIIKLVLRQGLIPVGMGTLLGMGITFAGKRLIAVQLFGVSALDPAVLLGSVSAIAVAAVAACWFPARRATQINPIRALRSA